MDFSGSPRPSRRQLSWGGVLLALVGVASCAAIAAAALRHTQSLAFPIDDAYIYSNYVLSAARGHPFTYNASETSGGITSLGWYFVSLLAYVLLSPLHSTLGGFAPPSVRQDAALAAQAGHLYLSAYLPGIACLVLTGLGVRRLAKLTLPLSEGREELRTAFCWLLGAVASADLGLAWGAMSGLEVTLSTATAVWAVCLLIEDASRGNMAASLVLAALLPISRPDLIVVGAVGAIWLAGMALLPSQADEARGGHLRNAALYLAGLAVGLALM
jgi:hypothetical protein